MDGIRADRSFLHACLDILMLYPDSFVLDLVRVLRCRNAAGLYPNDAGTQQRQCESSTDSQTGGLIWIEC